MDRQLKFGIVFYKDEKNEFSPFYVGYWPLACCYGDYTSDNVGIAFFLDWILAKYCNREETIKVGILSVRDRLCGNGCYACFPTYLIY
jgi:hypothetical protein